MLVKKLVLLVCASVLFNQIDQTEALGACGVSSTIQTCLNCARVASSCPTVLESQTGVVNGSQCKVKCEENNLCHAALYSGAYQECNVFGCVGNNEIDIDYGGVVYRRACHSDCPVFEVTSYGDTDIDSACVMQTVPAASTDTNCFAHCMDIVGCRAAVINYSTTTCVLFSCTTQSFSSDFEAWIKECRTPPPPVVQTCHNCLAGSKCTEPMYVKAAVTSHSTCSAECSAYDDCGMYVYNRGNEECSFHFCNQVSYDATNASIAFRRTYNTDCPNYQLIRISGRSGLTASSNIIEMFSLSEPLCLERCLETAGCLAITHFSSNCMLHSGQGTTANAMAVFYKRICHDDCVAITQTCLNCDQSSVCQNSYSSFSVHLTTECNGACSADDNCETAVFEPSSSQCSLYQCPRLSYSHYNMDYNLNTHSTNAVFRKTCKADCPVFRLQSKGLSKGTCPMIGEDFGDVEMDYCVHRCLDMDNCTAVSYSSEPTGVLCLYHSCDNHEINVTLSNHMFIWRECEQACNTTVQTCINCAHGNGCQQSFQELTGVVSSTNCNTACANNDSCNSAVFNFTNETCALSECSKVEYNVHLKAFRRSCSAACPVYSLHKRYNYTAAGATESYNGIWSYQECLASCLDNDYCRSAIYWLDLQLCLHQNSTGGIYNSAINTVFVERDCSSGCDKIYTQTCRRSMPASYCPARMRQMTGINLIQDCFLSLYWTYSTSVHYIPSSSRCDYYDCGGVQTAYTAFPEKVARKSCINECPDIAVETLGGFYGNCDNVTGKLPDIETDQSICLEHCLDTSSCRGVNYNSVTELCYYLTGDCDATVPTMNDPDWTYIKIDCINTTGSEIQTCQNCDVDGCQSHFNEVAMTSSSDCRASCEASMDCLTSVYNISGGRCLLYQCNTITQSFAASNLFRKTNNADCTQYELYQNTGYAGDCDVMSTIYMVFFYQHCMEKCLDTPGCRGMTHVVNTSVAICYLHNTTCSELVSNSDAVYIIKDCLIDCVSPYTQTCFNCKPATNCPAFSYESPKNVTKPLNIDTAPLQLDDDVKQIWYSVVNMQHYHLNCPYVTRSDEYHSIVYRKSCSSDCLKYELFELLGYRGTCNEIGYLSGGVTHDTCLSKCLDMDQCNGVSVDTSTPLMRCIFHDCDNYTVASGYDFTRKRCIEDCTSPVIQECVGCSPHDSCIHYDSTTDVSLESVCENMELNGESFILKDGPANIQYIDNTMMSYNRTGEECKLFQCPLVKRENINFLHRNSCNADCTKYEIFTSTDYAGTCDVIGEDRGELVMLEQCTARCLDMPGCRATTYYASSGFCEYHNCSSYATSSNDSPTFVYKRCLDHEPPRTNDQICVDCRQSSYCQWYAHYETFKTSGECQAMFNSDMNNYTYYYDYDLRFCLYMDCHWIMQDYIAMNSVMFRRSTSNDCPIYRLLTLTDKHGSCPTLDFDFGVTADYCVNRCLDMDNCRAISYSTYAESCEYHSCADYQNATTSTTFVMRVCMTSTEYDPVKMYTQVIKDGRSDCGESWDTGKIYPVMEIENDIDAASDCDTSCVDCNVIIYSSSDRKCRQYECDRPAPNGEGNTVFRRTTNPECLNIYMTALPTRAPACSPYQTDVGFRPSSECIGQCLDDPYCKAVGLCIGQDVCTYYNCTDSLVSDSNTHFLIFKNCINECVSHTTQTCLNCKEGTICQPASDINSDTELNCLTDCNIDTNCEGLLYNISSSVCSEFQCGRVQQQYDSTFYRKSCDTDCPVYEMYTVQGIGTCAVFETMTEQWVSNPEVCYERCLDTFGCRGVTYSGNKCEYHQCDCFDQSTNSETFMWRYCLNDTSAKTNLTDPTDITSYPSICITTTSTTVSSTSISPTNSTPFTTIEPIYISPCFCNSGIYDNLTEEEILAEILKDLYLDAESTSSHFRKYNSAEDNRKSSVAIGTVGVGVIVSVAVAVVILDMPSLIKAFRDITNGKKIQPKKTKSKVTKMKNMSKTNATSDDTAI